MIKYLAKVRELQAQLPSCNIHQIPRSANVQADLLAKIATSQIFDLDNMVHIEVLEAPSTNEPATILCTSSELSWMDPNIDYLKLETLPTGSSAVRKVKCLTSHYPLIDGQLYKRSYSSPLLKCLPPFEVDHAVQEVHEGICGNHLGGRMLVYKILRQVYCWPTIQHDAIEYVRAFNS